MRILLVEDDVKIASFIVKGLRAAGYAVDHAPDGEEGLGLALTEPYDAAVIDLMLPKRNGLALIKEMRAEKVNTPVLILSAKGSVDDRVKGLETGGDDYLTKLRHNNFIGLASGYTGIRFRPHLDIDEKIVNEALAVLDKTLNQI